MKALLKGMMMTASLLLGSVGLAQESVEGVWAGKLEVAPGNSISVHFTLAQDAAGAWTAMLNSPDNGAIKNLSASSVSFDGNTLAMQFSALSGAYSGVLANGAITGEWTQPGSTLAMNLAPYVPSELSDEAKAMLLGQWHGKLQARGITLNIVFNFENDAAGAFTGNVQQIDTGPNKIAMSDISLENNELFFRIPQANSEYRAQLVNGGFNGSMKQGAQDMVLNVVKGEYVPEQVTLALADGDYDKLAGEWTGSLTPPGGQGELTLVMTFARDDSGTIVGTFRSPQQGNNPLKITTASLTGTTLSVALTVPPASFTGEMTDSGIVGTWKQGPGELPLTLSRQ